MIFSDLPLEFNHGRLLKKADIIGQVIPPKPVIITWSRFEPQPYNEDLTHSLQAPIADPLWMMARQWQFSEFRGEDAGTPIWSQLDGEIGHITRFQSGNADPVDYSHQTQPLEVMVESEPVHGRHPRMSAEAGEDLLRRLSVPKARASLRENFALDIDDDAIWAGEADGRALEWQALFRGRAVDGHAVFQALKGSIKADGAVSQLPVRLATVGDNARTRAAYSQWFLRNKNVLVSTAEENTAWQPDRQEYQFQLGTRLGNRELSLNAEEYTDGKLDWYSFDTKASTRLGTSADSSTPFKPRPLLPAPVRYAGMPADRYWEFEDGRVNLAYLDAGPTDLGRLLLAEFALVYSNDWFVIPVDMPVGSVFNVNTLKVRDTFGIEVDIQPARNFDGSRWTLFSLSGAERLPKKFQDLFLLPPTLPGRLEGDAIEEVLLFRDEMANMAWAVEHKVQGASGMPIDRRSETPVPAVGQRVDVDDIDAQLVYRLMTPIADNWLPFVPVAKNQGQSGRGNIGLERRTVLRTHADGSRTELHPRGQLMRSDTSVAVADEAPLRLQEEEVMREGAKVERSFQYCRWLDGQAHLWVGRRKSVGRGEGSSGLRFDVSVFTEHKQAPLATPQIVKSFPKQGRISEILNPSVKIDPKLFVR